MLESCLSIVANAVNFIEEAATTMSTSNTVAITILIVFPVVSLLSGHETSLRSLVRTFFSTHNCDPATTTMVEKLKGTSTDDHDLETDCVVCLGQVSKGEKYKILGNCKHGFHAHCIDAWLQRHSTCPLCRSPVPQKCTSMMQYCSINQEDRICDVFLSFLTRLMYHIHTWLINLLCPEIMSDIGQNSAYFP